jgi:Secretion system C-terminal sorting domain
MQVELIHVGVLGDELSRVQVYTEKPFGQMRSIHLLENGDIILAGTQSFDFDAVILRLDSTGTLLWQQTFQSPIADERDDLWAQSVMLNDSILVMSYGYGFDDEYPPIPSNASSVRELHLVKFNVNTQQVIWEVAYPSIYGASHYCQDIIKTTDEGFVVSGHVEHNPIYWPIDTLYYGYSFSYLAKMNAAGELQWKRRFTHSQDTASYIFSDNYLFDVEQAPDGGYVACGYLSDYDLNPVKSCWVIKVDEFGCLEPGCQTINVTELMLGFENTMRLYPNPVKDICTLSFDLDNYTQIQKNFSQTEIIITDLQGREVLRRSLPSLGSQYSLELDMGSYSSGLYHIHWVSGSTWLDSLPLVKE